MKIHIETGGILIDPLASGRLFGSPVPLRRFGNERRLGDRHRIGCPGILKSGIVSGEGGVKGVGEFLFEIAARRRFKHGRFGRKVCLHRLGQNLIQPVRQPIEVGNVEAERRGGHFRRRRNDTCGHPLRGPQA